MKVDGKHTRTIWVEADGSSVGIIDQTALPHRFTTIRLTTVTDVARAIATMQVRGAPLIGAFRSYRGGHALNLKLLTQAFAAGALALETPAGRSGDRAARTALSP